MGHPRSSSSELAVVSTRRFPQFESQPPEHTSEDLAPVMPSIRPRGGKLGPYQLLCELASGGMGRVYVARRTYEGNVSRVVALKTIHPHLAADSHFSAMFLEEARIASRISHPYVCRIEDLGTDAGVAYVAMEYLVGEPLSRVLAAMPRSFTDVGLACAVRMIALLCEGLHAAHEVKNEEGTPLHVVHRDISPENLFVMYDGTVRVTDFGIALAAESKLPNEQGAIVGKFAYMSPEQLRAGHVDRRSDIWSMGVVLWEMLTGQPLFPRHSSVHSAVAVLDQNIVPPSKINPRVPTALDKVVLKALSRRPEDRFATARDMATTLEAIQATHLGPVAPALLGSWLDRLFPAVQNFRQRIVFHAREAQAESGIMTPTSRLAALVGDQPDFVQAFESHRGQSISFEPTPPAPYFDRASGPYLFLPDEEPTSRRAAVQSGGVGFPSTHLAPFEVRDAELIAIESLPPEAVLERVEARSTPLVSQVRAPRVSSKPWARYVAAAASALALGVAAFVLRVAPSASGQATRSVAVAPKVAAAAAETARAPEAPGPLAQPAPTVEPRIDMEFALNEVPSVHAPRSVPRAAAEQEVTAKVIPSGRLFVTGIAGQVEVAGHTVDVPASLRLPVGDHPVTVRQTGSNKTTSFSVHVELARTTLLELDGPEAQNALMSAR